MRRKHFKTLFICLLVFTFILGTVSVHAKTPVNPQAASSGEVMPRMNIVCPACGAIGYPTGRVMYLPGSIGDTPSLMRFMPLYMEMKCSADPTHIWYEYIAEATE